MPQCRGVRCFVLVLGLLGPRLALLYVWLFTPRVTEAFDGVLFDIANYSARAAQQRYQPAG